MFMTRILLTLHKYIFKIDLQALETQLTRQPATLQHKMYIKEGKKSI